MKSDNLKFFIFLIIGCLFGFIATKFEGITNGLLNIIGCLSLVACLIFFIRMRIRNFLGFILIVWNKFRGD
ncbi:hypothetical protein OMS_01519 [Enterococcus durans ATCC 6056]|uniref:Lipoprotein n=2 Tax=Enterococcus durans TaxID=53345 RepID=A0AB36SB70_9ENTE|nr:hypothetical protein OMS_01519 [Enterococcus durans ATCC 6056]EOU25416.1 hypothetical protein I571_00066 [Enterococcus durans ATCC 6056]PEH46109.1 hypothetical protein CRM96_14490 [Enterococcus durans]